MKFFFPVLFIFTCTLSFADMNIDGPNSEGYIESISNNVAEKIMTIKLTNPTAYYDSNAKYSIIEFSREDYAIGVSLQNSLGKYFVGKKIPISGGSTALLGYQLLSKPTDGYSACK